MTAANTGRFVPVLDSPSGGAVLPLGYDRRVFSTGGKPWVYKGISFFKLGELAQTGQWSLIDQILGDFDGFNTVRGWDYVPWPGTGWLSPGVNVWFQVLEHLRVRGWRLELTLLTDDDPARLEPAKRLVSDLSAPLPPNLLFEIGNEPRTHKHIDVEALHAVCDASGLPYASGNNALDEPFFGKGITHHSSRDNEWQRKGGHDLMEFYTGDGPEGPHEPWHVPAWNDEPQKPHDALAMRGGDLTRTAQDYKAYFASCALLGAGACFHYEGGKFGQRPTPDELACAKAALEGLTAIPPGTPNASPGYRRIDEQGKSIRTYCCGDRMVRIPPLTTTAAPEAGWTDLYGDGICWRRT